jgi:hypothetical protein
VDPLEVVELSAGQLSGGLKEDVFQLPLFSLYTIYSKRSWGSQQLVETKGFKLAPSNQTF